MGERKQWGVPGSSETDRRIPSAKYMNPFEIPPGSSEEKDPRARKQWGNPKKPLTPLEQEDLETLGIKKNWKAEKFTNFDEDRAENQRMMITDNLISDEFAEAMQEAGESEPSEVSPSHGNLEQLLMKASSKELDMLRQSLSNFGETFKGSNLGETLRGKEKDEEDYGDDFEEIEEDVHEENKQSDESVEEIIENYSSESDDNDFDRQIEAANWEKTLTQKHT